MDISINLVISIVVAVAAILILSFLANTYITGGQEIALEWLP